MEDIPIRPIEPRPTTTTYEVHLLPGALTQQLEELRASAVTVNKLDIAFLQGSKLYTAAIRGALYIKLAVLIVKLILIIQSKEKNT